MADLVSAMESGTNAMAGFTSAITVIATVIACLTNALTGHATDLAGNALAIAPVTNALTAVGKP
ncbi:MAG: hypothetical protein WCQ95_11750 [Bacteroidota bacterium]